MSFKEHFCFASHDLTDQFPTQVINEMKTMGVAPINLEGIESGPIFTNPASRRVGSSLLKRLGQSGHF